MRVFEVGEPFSIDEHDIAGGVDSDDGSTAALAERAANAPGNAVVVEDDNTPNLVARYFRDVRQFPLLTRAEEQRLFRRLEMLDVRACRILHLSPTTPTALAELRTALAGATLSFAEVVEHDDGVAGASAEAFCATAEEVGGLFARLEGLNRQRARSRSSESARRVRLERRTLMREIDRKFAKELRLQGSVYNTLRSALESRYLAIQNIERPDDRTVWVSYTALIRTEARIKAVTDRIVCSNTRLAIEIANRYRGRGVPFLDLIQEANMGLMRTVRKFDYRRNLKFCTYATWWTRQAITRSLTEQKRIVRFPNHVEEGLGRFRETLDELTSDLGRIPTIEELAAKLGWPRGQIQSKLEAIRGCVYPISLNRPLKAAGKENVTLFDALPDLRVIPAKAREIRRSVDALIASLLASLSDRERFILVRRFGLEDYEPHTLQKIANLLDLSRERVRQLEKLAMEKLERLAAPHAPLAQEFFHLRAQEE